MYHYDVLIIGSGIGGLTCGARLATLGYKVAVFDHHYLPGGYATNFQRKGYTFDAALHGVGGLAEGQSFHQILQGCGVASRIRPIQKEYSYSIQWGEEKVHIPQALDDYRLILHERFPTEKVGINGLFEEIRKLQLEMRFLNDPTVSNSQIGLYLRWAKLTTEQVIQQYVSSEEFISFFTVLWDYYGLPPKRLSSLYFFIPWIGYHMEGTYYIQGGSQALSNAFVAVIEEQRGNVYLNHEVTDILIDGNQAYGIRTKKGLEFTGEWVVSNASPHDTLGTLISDHPRAQTYRETIATKEIGPSILQLYIGLACHPEELGIQDEELLFVEERDYNVDYEKLMAGRYDAVNFGLTNYSKIDPTLNPYQHGVLTITLLDNFKNWPEDKEKYQHKKEEVTALLIQRLEKYYPGLKDKVVITELGTPRTMKSYTKNPNGAVYGFAQTVDQSGIKRTNQETPIEKLSLVGAWTQPGGGFRGAATSGFMEADRIHRRLIRN